MSTLENREALYQRARQDYAAYIARVAGPEKTREEVIAAAAEIAAMQSFLESIRTGVFEELYIDAMLTFEHPLEILLDDWQSVPGRLQPVTMEVMGQCCDEAAHQLLTVNYDYSSLSPESKALIDEFNEKYWDGRLPEGYNQRQPDQLWPVLERRLSDDYRRGLVAAARLPDAGAAALAVDDLQRMYHFLLNDPMTRLNQTAAFITAEHPLDMVMAAWERSGKCCELSTVVEMAVDDILFPNVENTAPPQAAAPALAEYCRNRVDELLRRLGHDLTGYRDGEGEATPTGLQYRQDIVAYMERYKEILYCGDAELIDVLLTCAHPLDAIYKQWESTFQPGERVEYSDACDAIGWAVHLRQQELAAHRAGDSPYVQFYYQKYSSPAPGAARPEDPEAGDDDFCR